MSSSITNTQGVMYTIQEEWETANADFDATIRKSVGLMVVSECDDGSAFVLMLIVLQSDTNSIEMSSTHKIIY